MKRARKFQRGPRSNPANRIGIAWLDPETHARILDIMVQPHKIPWQFERWREVTESQESFWKSRSFFVVRIVIDPEKFLAWCQTVVIKPNGKALESYAHQRAQGAIDDNSLVSAAHS